MVKCQSDTFLITDGPSHNADSMCSKGSAGATSKIQQHRRNWFLQYLDMLSWLHKICFYKHDSILSYNQCRITCFPVDRLKATLRKTVNICMQDMMSCVYVHIKHRLVNNASLLSDMRAMARVHLGGTTLFVP